MNKAVLLLNTNNSDYNAGSKAQLDIVKFLHEKGFQQRILTVKNTSFWSKVLFGYVTLPHFVKQLSKIDELIIQYPMSRFLMRRLVELIRAQGNIKIYGVIHDIESLRTRLGDESFKSSEISLLNSLDGVIVHNEKMSNWLINSGLKVKTVPLYLFDYDNSQPINKEANYRKQLCFAGNLAKSTFLKELHLRNSSLYLYGSGLPSGVEDNRIYYQGSFAPNELPKYLTQDFGLVWDGESIDTCKGTYGQYTKYNAPHKVSLYLSCGMPVIVWKRAGVAKYIADHNLGITVDSLTQLDDLLSNIKLKDYESMKENSIQEAQRLRNGNFIEEAVRKLES